jgi:signal transduction histidine kinase
MFIKLQTKLGIFLIILLIVFVAGIVLLRILELNTVYAILSGIELEKKSVFEKIYELKGASLQTLAYDYTYWDEMVNFAKSGDRKWAQQNIDTALSTFKVNAAWVYRTDWTLVYSANDLEDATYRNIPLSREDFKELFAPGYFRHFFVYTPKGLLEIRTAPIQPTADSERKTPPRGYFFTGRVWNEAQLKELSKLTESEITLLPIKDEGRYKDRKDLIRGIVVFSKILPDWKGEPLAQIFVKSTSAVVTEHHKATNQILLFSTIFMIFIITISSLMAMRWVVYPLNLAIRSLDAKDASLLGNLKSEKSEFGRLADLIVNFFSQNRQLLAEIEERKKAEEDLKENMLKLRELDEMKSDFVSTVSHELRTPLTVIKEGIDLVLSRALGQVNPQQEECLGMAGRNIDRLNKLITNVLDISKIEAGITGFSGEKVELPPLLKNIVEPFQPVSARKGLKLKLLCEELPAIHADPDKIVQILSNLLNNAFKFTQHGGVTVSARPYLDFVEISVADTGPGIAEEDLRKLFSKFSQVGNRYERPSGGTGLGLYITRNLVELMGGRIRAESEAGQGTKFIFTLPVYKPESDKGT